jgi:C-terminal processing protease CtpA/Prc
MVRRSMAKSVPILILFGLVLRCTGSVPDPETRFSPTELRADLQELRQQILEHHPLTFADRREVRDIFDRQASLLTDSLTSLEFFRIAAPAVAAAKCWHTRLMLPDAVFAHWEENGHYLPFDLRVIRDSLFVRSVFMEDHRIAPGDVVSSINGKPATEIVHILRSCLPSDGGNTAAKDWLLNDAFSSYYRTYIGSPAEIAIGYASTEHGDSGTVDVPAISRSALRRRTELSDEKPKGGLIETSFDADEGFAILRIRFFEYYDDFDFFADPIDSFFTELAGMPGTSLILDLRGNDGGDAYSAAYLLGYLLREPFRYFAPGSTHLLGDLKGPQPIHDNRFGGDLFVLVDGGCCSTTGHLLAILKSRGVGKYIGTPTGGGYACNGGFRGITLKHTKLQLLLPHAVFIADAEDLLRGYQIAPDYTVESSILDLLAGTDPALDSAKSLIARMQ